MKNKLNTKIITSIVALSLAMSMVPVFAASESSSDDYEPSYETPSTSQTMTSEAVLNAQPATFSVTVPTSLPVNIDASGAVTVATDAKITNNSAAPIKVVKCQMNTLNNWTISNNLSNSKVGTKKFNFTLNDKAFGTDGSYDVSNWNSIGANESLTLNYSSQVAPQKNTVNEGMASVVFTIDWDV